MVRSVRPKLELGPNPTLGERLRYRRLERGDRMIDAAEASGVDVKTWMWWERDTHEPTDRQYPAIISYLEYEPWPEPIRVAEHLRAERRRRGWAVRHAADELGIDPMTLSRWESGVWTPQPRSVRTIEAFLGRLWDPSWTGMPRGRFSSAAAQG